ncbi:MAG: hypothetical protein AB7P49_06310 [Bdellovibrionales bacterium]
MEKKIRVLEHCIGELTLERELKKSAKSKKQLTRELVLKFAPEHGVRTLARALGISRQRVYFTLKNPVQDIRRKRRK